MLFLLEKKSEIFGKSILFSLWCICIYCDTSAMSLTPNAKGMRRRDYSHGTLPLDGSKAAEDYAFFLNDNYMTCRSAEQQFTGFPVEQSKVHWNRLFCRSEFSNVTQTILRTGLRIFCLNLPKSLKDKYPWDLSELYILNVSGTE